MSGPDSYRDDFVLLMREPSYAMLKALAGDPVILAASDEQELRARYKTMVERFGGPQWRQTSIETPTNGQGVLGWWSKDKIEGIVFDEGVWYYLQDGDSPNSAPTHWMPLPNPPCATQERNDG